MVEISIWLVTKTHQKGSGQEIIHQISYGLGENLTLVLRNFNVPNLTLYFNQELVLLKQFEQTEILNAPYKQITHEQ